MRAWALVSLSAALVLAGCGSQREAGTTQVERADARRYVLAPNDFGRGYRVGDDSTCGQFSPEESSERFTTFVRETRPAGCVNEINYIWGGARAKVVPRSASSAVVIFDDESDARRGMELRKELIDFMVPVSSRGFAELPAFGHEAVSFRDGGYDVPPGAGVFWRNGNLLATVFATGPGLTTRNAPEVALKLARMQQKRIEHPKAPPAERSDDEELPLDDPALDAPVYWLGREFDPRDGRELNPVGGMPSLHFGAAHTFGGSGGEPTFTAELEYGSKDARTTDGVRIHVFTPKAFQGFERTILGRLVRGTPCSEATEIELPKGRVVVWGGFAKPTRPPCPNLPYDRYFAHVYLKGAVVTVNAPLCIYPCLANPHGVADPYNTPRGLEVVARGLRVREPRPG